MTAIELEKVNSVTSAEVIIRDNTKCELNVLSILNLFSDTVIIDKIFVNITLDQIAKPTSLIKNRLNHNINTRVLI